MQRRASGEVINATLLEVFLAFVFLVLTLAYFERSRADSATGELGISRRQLDSMVSKNKRLAQERDSLQALYLSQFVPKCDDGVPVMQVRLSSPAQWLVVRRAKSGRWEEDAALVAPEEFAGRFTLSGQLSPGRACRYVVEVIDEGALNKEQFKEALRIITRLYYQTGAYRRSTPR
jgi:hypothetical protein